VEPRAAFLLQWERCLTLEIFDGGCVFIDSATGFIHLVLQVNLNMHKMLNAIHEFEQVCRNHGVVFQLYHSNNTSVFTSEGMAEKLKRFVQTITFAGAGTHHHASELVTFHHKFHHSSNNRQTVTTPGMSQMLSCEFNINTIHLLILGLDVHHSLGPIACD
jgi:hypothetical protein